MYTPNGITDDGITSSTTGNAVGACWICSNGPVLVYHYGGPCPYSTYGYISPKPGPGPCPTCGTCPTCGR